MVPISTNYFYIFEAWAFFFFLLIIGRKIYQRNFIGIFEIVSCAIFGMILEIGNTYLAHSYYYSSSFLVNMGHVPIAIGLGWAIIIYCAMLLSDQYHIPWTLRPFMDALTAVILDIAMDTIAIRLGFWHWTIPLDREWYGVPFENIIGWILVVLCFSFLIRFIRTLNYKRFMTKVLMILSPLLSYIFLIIGLVIFGIITIIPYQINGWATLLELKNSLNLSILSDPQVELWKLIILMIVMTELANIVVWSIIKYRRNYLKKFDLVSFVALTGIHLFFLIAIFSSGLYRKLPILAVISLVALTLHLLAHLFPYIINRKTIYIFKTVKEATRKEEREINTIIKTTLK